MCAKDERLQRKTKATSREANGMTYHVTTLLTTPSYHHGVHNTTAYPYQLCYNVRPNCLQKHKTHVRVHNVSDEIHEI